MCVCDRPGSGTATTTATLLRSSSSMPLISHDSRATSSEMDLVWPAATHLASYTRALQEGWSPDNLRPEAALDELERIRRDSGRFIAEQVDREGSGPPVTLP